ncbi:MAG: AGE family epimerase/isomerase [Acidobacteria bacterium]|jgi:mannobiose 2-epimerase|nr:AGE family epimerase/isomerase [Acidobacteriota bacterium]
MHGIAPFSALAEAMERDLRENVLPFWMGRAPDETHGGFLGYLADDGTVDPAGPKGGVLNARILWTFAAAFHRYGEPAYRETADRALSFLLGHFWDEAHGGIYWMLDHEGRPLSDRKQTYAIAFALYALAEYHRATGSDEALDRAVRLFRSIEEHATDPAHGGYWEARARDWTPLEDVRLSEKDRNSPKSMNTHLHVMEAYTNLLRVWEGEDLRARLRALLEIHLERIVDPVSGHLLLFFDEAWRPVDRAISYGHDIEASWLMVEAAAVLGEAGLRERATGVAEKIARVTLAEGFDREHGGVFAEKADGGPLDDEKHWWMQAEAIVGFVNAWEVIGDEAFLEAAESSWRFVDQFLIDHTHGEWRWRVTRAGNEIPGLPKVEPWKCPYHNSRAALEVAARAARAR